MNLTVEQARQMFIRVAEGVERSEPLLTDADRAIGDGDHGTGMARGFSAARAKLEAQTFETLEDLLKAIGMSLMTTMGGASGVIFGTLFRGGSKRLAGRTLFDAEALALMLTDGLQGIKERGKASVGDKTMIDALEPAALKAQEMTTASLNEALAAAAEAARQGMEHTKEIPATMGRAKTLGERSLGHPDPGALSTYLILSLMAEYVAQQSS